MNPNASVSAAKSLAFLAAIYAALLAYQWFVVPTRVPVFVYGGGAILLAVAILDPIRRGETFESVGLTRRHFRRALRLLGIPTLVLFALLLVANFALSDSPHGERFLKRLAFHVPWAFVQQGLLQATFNRRLLAVWGPGWRTAITVGVLMGGMHFPNLPLVAATAVLGTGWAAAYARAPNLWLTAVSQGLLSASAQSMLPPDWTHHFRVGPSYR